MDDPIKTMRDNLYKQVEESLQKGETVNAIVVGVVVQFKILDMLDSIDSRLISLEDEVSKLNSTYK